MYNVIQLDFWYRDHDIAHVLVPPECLEQLKRNFDASNLLFRVLNDHIQRSVYDNSGFKIRKKNAKFWIYELVKIGVLRASPLQYAVSTS